MTEVLVLETQSPEDTERLGAALMRMLGAAAVVALRGELASGKTCLVRGMAAAISAAGADEVHSPTFTLINEYGDNPKLYHMDLYRLGDVDEIAHLGCEELFDSEDGICVVEWAERAEALLPARRLDVSLVHLAEDRRRFTFDDHGLLPDGWQDALVDAQAASA